MTSVSTNQIINSAISEAQAKTELNATMLKLRSTYGFAPAKGTKFEEMKARCEAVVESVDRAVEAYVEATGKAPVRMRNTSKYVTSKEFPAKKYEGLQAYANVPDDRLKIAPLYTLEAAGNLLDYNAEYLIRIAHMEAVASRTRAEWQRMEYEYVERNDYNLRDLYDDLMKRLDASEDYITPDEYREERRKWRRCKYYACDNYYPIAKDHYKSARFNWTGLKSRPTNSEYCCDECKKGQENAETRFKKTGTFLPAYAYEYILGDTKEKKEKRNIPKEHEKIVRITDKSS
ncbi:hypothetical protein P4597_18965 [Peribacillus simplex]|uniref:hypothetical protein n=1 Tax=Peribacillus simplex TaxID=1478 RepID=UPI002E207ECF|nr:hypothetical protein [Peribacillus simplex]